MSDLDEDRQLTVYRTLQIILSRMGRPADVKANKLIAWLEPRFPADSYEVNWLLCETLAWLQSSEVAAKTMALIAKAPTQEEQMQYARSIRMLKNGRTPELREAYFEWFLKAAIYRGGASFEKFVQFIRDDAVASLTDNERETFKDLLAKKPEQKSVLENLGAMFEGRTPTNWKLDALTEAVEDGMQERDFEKGRELFAAAGCYACHRFQNQGGMTGPDLSTAGRRYAIRD